MLGIKLFKTPVLFVLLFSATLLCEVECLSSGAPAAACQTLTPLLPQHIEPPQTSQVPYEVDIAALDDGNDGFSYVPGETYTCT